LTYSIVARDTETGELGVAVQSHYFCAGSVVAWAEAGVGAVATQSIVEVSYGPKGLDLMREGMKADACLTQLIADDQMASLRQVAIVDASGALGVHTGSSCIGFAGHRRAHQVSAQANMMEHDTVWDAMIEAYSTAADCTMADRLLIALEAAEAEGGDVRGKQSAALLVVSGERTATPWDHKKVDLRVDDSEDPLQELRRLLAARQAVDLLDGVFNSGLLFSASLESNANELLAALRDLEAVQQVLGPNREPTFWSAVLLAKAGRISEAQQLLTVAAETNPRWWTFLNRLADAGIIPADCKLLHH